ncbi:hypothetical protein QP519_07470 [Weeksella virosa]|uniref:hypothetical protein n=1 Tax=Weeksella virosa TaxID=1014 RepID=UPI000E023E05|nr:hypothetical protein [Weeksella virosa]MDK7375381.1 hypothetical protein [Weeksella virosa]SUP53913.1 Uncharacterised protein [Weeksella virosa]
MKQNYRKKNWLLFGLFFFSFFWLVTCKKGSTYHGDYNPDEIKSYKNDHTSLGTKMDSTQAIDFISKQKLREFYELSTLAVNTQDSVLSHMLWSQLKSYFSPKDTVEIMHVLEDLRSKNVKFTSINSLHSNPLDSIYSDTLKRIHYTVNYFAADKKLIESNERISILVLKKDPQKFVKEFKFYFKTLNDFPPKDSISVDDTIASRGTSPR